MHFFYNPHKFHLKEKGAHILDKVILPIAMISPLMTVPQVLQVWVDGKVEGVSVTTWSAYALGTLFWTLYGLAHKEKPIFYANFFLFIFDVVIVLGVLLHKL